MVRQLHDDRDRVDVVQLEHAAMVVEGVASAERLRRLVGGLLPRGADGDELDAGDARGHAGHVPPSPPSPLWDSPQ